jgi:hypothetical protein
MRDRQKGWVGLGLATRSGGDVTHDAESVRVQRSRSRRGHRTQLAHVMTWWCTGWRQGAAGELTGATGRAPDKGIRCGAHPSGGVAERRWRMLRATTFVGGEGGPVAGGDGGTTL